MITVHNEKVHVHIYNSGICENLLTECEAQLQNKQTQIKLQYQNVKKKNSHL